MSNWDSKSETSFKASNKLIVETLFNASVHSSYYSCVQYMLHILSMHQGMSDEEIDNLNQISGTTTHKFLKTAIFTSLRSMNPDYAVDFNDDIGTLCSRRVTADYKSEIIKEEEAIELRQIAYDTLRMLKQTYQ